MTKFKITRLKVGVILIITLIQPPEKLLLENVFKIAAVEIEILRYFIEN